MPSSKLFIASLCAAAALPLAASTDVLYFVENSKIVPGDSNLWKVDTAAKTATKAATLDKTGLDDVVSGAVVCGNKYLACWDTYPSNYGILNVDLSSSNYTHIFAEGDYLFHAVGCDPSDANSAFAIGSTPNSHNLRQSNNNKGHVETSAQFSLIKYNLQDNTQTKVADFPDVKGAVFEGMDAEFRFEADGKTAIMVVGKKSLSVEPVTSYVYTMDTASGSLTGSYTTKLHALDTVFDGLKRAVTLDARGSKYHLNWADLSCEGKSCFVKVTGSADDDWDAGKPFAVCGDDAWVVPTGPTGQPLVQSSIANGGAVTILDLADQGVKGEAGGLAAVCSQ